MRYDPRDVEGSTVFGIFELCTITKQVHIDYKACTFGRYVWLMATGTLLI